MAPHNGMKRGCHDCLDGVLPELVDEAGLLRGALQNVDRFMQVKFTALPENRARLGASREDGHR
jgi:hypothetical protein